MTYIQTYPSSTGTAPLTWNYNNVEVTRPTPEYGITTGGNFITYNPDQYGNAIHVGGSDNFFDTGTTTTINNNPGKSMTTSIKTVRVKAGYLGQVVTSQTIEQFIVWESKPKKTLRKAEKAARKAQLRAVERSFE